MSYIRGNVWHQVAGESKPIAGRSYTPTSCGNLIMATFPTKEALAVGDESCPMCAKPDPKRVEEMSKRREKSLRLTES